MHTFEGKNGTIIHYNGDFSGNMHIARSNQDADSKSIDSEDLIEFVLEEIVLPRLTDGIKGQLADMVMQD